MTVRNLILLLLCAVLLGACSSSRKSDALGDTLRGYANALRWSDLETAMAFMSPEAREEITALQMERFRQFKISSYSERNAQPQNDGVTVRQTVDIGLINIHTSAEKRIVDRQVWEWNDDLKRWWLVSGLPDVTSGNR